MPAKTPHQLFLRAKNLKATNYPKVPNNAVNTTNVKNMYLHRDSNPGPWNTVPRSEYYIVFYEQYRSISHIVLQTLLYLQN